MTNDTGDTDDGGGLKRPLGPTGEVVRANVTRLRAFRRLGYTELSERLKDLDKRISPLGLRRIENGARRIDVDDLFALAVALGVSPATLLITNADDGDERVAVTGVTEECDAERLWKWMQIEESIDPDVERLDPDMERLEFRLAALPTWKRRQLIKFVDAKFEGGGSLSADTGKAE
jgi:transcriptional regulator with XRE-family HTH domain